MGKITAKHMIISKRPEDKPGGFAVEEPNGVVFAVVVVGPLIVVVGVSVVVVEVVDGYSVDVVVLLVLVWY